MEIRFLLKLVTHIWDIMYGRKAWKFVFTGVQSEKYKWQQTSKQEAICCSKSQIALSHLSMFVISKENLKTNEDQHLYVLAEHPAIKLYYIITSWNIKYLYNRWVWICICAKQQKLLTSISKVQERRLSDFPFQPVPFLLVFWGVLLTISFNCSCSIWWQFL